MTSDLISVQVTGKTKEAEDICSFELARPDGAALPAFTAGSHIDVHINDNLTRQYSLCNNPAERHRYQLAVLREKDGTGGSDAMHDTVSTGDVLSISKPRNSFHLVEETGYSLLLAGGIGVTPVMCMAQRLHALGAHFGMHYCTRSRARTAFHDFLVTSAFSDRVHFHFDDGDAAQLLDIPKLLEHPASHTHLYVCGPGGFMEAVISAAETSWPADNIHREYFSADPSAGHDDDDSFEVKLSSTGQVYTIPPDKSIVQALGEAGVDIPVSCEQGICGTCLTRVLEGEPEHRDLFLSDAEHEANDQMTPCCSRARSRLLVLDL